MLVVALSAFGITEMHMFGPFSWIHALALFTLFALAQGVWYARRRNLKGHKRTMISLYCFALLLTGAFTLLPGRRMHAVVFADGGLSAGSIALALILGLSTIAVIRIRRA